MKEAHDVKKAIIESFVCLTFTEQKVILDFFFTDKTQSDTGQSLYYPVTPCRVGQIKSKALRKIRRTLWLQEEKREDILASYTEHYSL